jgi:hypothetical protein
MYSFVPFNWGDGDITNGLQATITIKNNITLQSKEKEQTSLLISEKEKFNIFIKNNTFDLFIKEKENLTIFIKGE